ncbi:MAG: hypothetical protein K0S32_1291 [Bacteroidetes bacterium]|jgi:hypothetical protein|nr:hypothetical protein [Bacteroidota bacterium]
MKNNLRLSIPETCHADWSSMTPNKEGKHCALCDKTVIDFTKMSPEEIRIYFQKNAGKKVCGNLYSHQLDHKKNKVQLFFTNLYNSIHANITTRTFRLAALFFVGMGLFIAGCRTRFRGAIDGMYCDDPRHLHGYTPTDSVKNAPVHDTLKKEK